MILTRHRCIASNKPLTSAIEDASSLCPDALSAQLDSWDNASACRAPYLASAGPPARRGGTPLDRWGTHWIHRGACGDYTTPTGSVKCASVLDDFRKCPFRNRDPAYPEWQMTVRQWRHKLRAERRVAACFSLGDLMLRRYSPCFQVRL